MTPTPSTPEGFVAREDIEAVINTPQSDPYADSVKLIVLVLRLLSEREAETRRAEAYREGWARCLCEYDQKVTGGVMQSGKYHEAVDAQALQILNERKEKKS